MREKNGEILRPLGCRVRLAKEEGYKKGNKGVTMRLSALK